MKKGKFARSVALVCALALPVGTVAVTTTSCASAPKQFNAEGKIAFYANEVIVAVKQAVEVNARAKEAGSYSKADAIKVNDALGEVGKQGIVLADALAASGAQSDEVQKARAAILSLLGSALEQVDENTRNIIKPYFDIIVNLLKFLELRG